MNRKLASVAIVFVALLAVVGDARRVVACPFCSAQSQTLSEEMNTMDAVVLATLEELPPPAKKDDPGSEVPKAKFKITEVLKGQSLVAKTPVIETVYFGDGKKGKLFLVMGVGPENIQWSTPLQVSPTVHKYLLQLPKLPKDGADRLVFFQNHLEDSEDLLARDSYDEFAKAPYQAVKDLKPRMKREQLVGWIKNPDVPTSRRRLYFTMLGVCGEAADIPMLKEMILSTDRKQRAGLDALVACYLILTGPEGMKLVEETFLKNTKAEYADTYAAIMALRFHATDTNIIPKERLLEGFRHMLERPQLADLVIPDLARWEDWTCMERLVELFKKADEKTSWVKVPVVNYLRACPLPIAKDYIKELEKLDPESVKRAHTFFPLPSGTAPASPSKS